MEINDIDYICWHEMGHAFTCIHLGGSVEDVEILDNNDTCYAVARCKTNETIRKKVACAGFAAELMLFRDNYLGEQDEKEMCQILFKNATHDRNSYHSLKHGSQPTEFQDRDFMNFAYKTVLPIIRNYKNEIATAVAELRASKKITGNRIKEIMYGS